MNKYKYTGTIKVHLPSISKNVAPGDIFETTDTINHPEFVLIRDENKEETKDNKLDK